MDEQLLQRIEKYELIYNIERSYAAAQSLIEAYRQMARSLEDVDPKRATEYLKKVRDVATQLLSNGDRRMEKERICALHDAAAIALRHKAFGAAQNYLEEAMTDSKQWTEREVTLQSLASLYETQDYMGKLGMVAGYPLDAVDCFLSAEETACRMLELERNEEIELMYVMALTLRAEAKVAARDADGALEAYQLALDVLDAEHDASLKNLQMAINISRQVSNLLWRVRAVDRAIHYAENAIARSDRLIEGDKTLESMREAVLSYYNLGQKTEALGGSKAFLCASYYMKAMRLAQENVDRYGTPRLKDDLATAACAFGQATQTPNNVKEAIEIWNELSQQPNGNVYLQKKQYAQRILAQLMANH
ncbi:MAG: hypothetical protein IKJ35_03660 [Clostridia bacterium]|nr:hypothetical protein [Clostridia bacterium]